jgi:hypothetical protein
MLRQAITDLIREPMTKDDRTRNIFWQFPEDFDNQIRSRLDRGRQVCNDRTLVLWYCYVYQQMHIAAFRRLMDVCAGSDRHNFEWNVFRNVGNIFMLDIGCGPMTSCLAMADCYLARYRRPLNICYVGVDCEQAMIDKATEFARYPGLFDVGSHFEFIRTSGYALQDVDAGRLLGRITRSGTLIINLAYVLAQPGSHELVAPLADLIRQLMNAYDSEAMYITYLNPGQFFDQNYNALRERLGFGFDPPESFRYDCYVPRRLYEGQALLRDRPVSIQCPRVIPARRASH